MPPGNPWNSVLEDYIQQMFQAQRGGIVIDLSCCSAMDKFALHSAHSGTQEYDTVYLNRPTRVEGDNPTDGAGSRSERIEAIEAIASLRGLGKREVTAKLSQLKV